MHNVRKISSALLLGVMFAVGMQAHAEPDKNIIALQVQIQQLQDALARLQQASDERWALTKAALDANTDSLTRISTALTTMQQQIAAQSDASQTQQLSQQIQSTHDAVDEVRARMGRLEKAISDLQTQMQNIPQQAAPAQQSQAAPDAGQPQQQDAGQAQAAPQQPAAPPAKDLYQSAYRDYSGARYDLASQEFAQVVQAYPQDDLAGNAQFYLGEIAYRQGKYREAAKAFDAVLTNYPGSTKSAVAMLRKGDCLVQIGQRAAGIRALRALIQRYPQSPEAMQARSTLNGMGVTPTPRTTAQ